MTKKAQTQIEKTQNLVRTKIQKWMTQAQKTVTHLQKAADTSAAANNQRVQYAIARELSTTKMMFTASAIPGLTRWEEMILGAAEMILGTAEMIQIIHRLHIQPTAKGLLKAKKQVTEKCNSILAVNADIFTIIN